MRDDYLSITAPVFNIQTYSIHDGPGIRVTVFVKGCPLRCLWCANPESNLAKSQLIVYLNKCTGCGACVDKCPKGAISLQVDGNSAKAHTDRSACVDCGACVEVCPADARELSGKDMSVREVLDVILKDKLFLDDSGGGMTLSGGECLMYPDFAEALFFASKQEGLTTAIETCSYAARETVDQVFQYVDICLLDVKHMDSETHKKLTSVPNERILDHIRHVYHDLHKDVTIRVPVIPGYNDSPENIAATARFAAEELGRDVHVHLLPYHRMGESKNESLGKEIDWSIQIPSDEHMNALKAIVESYGLQAQIGG